jgi:hypothetical protein
MDCRLSTLLNSQVTVPRAYPGAHTPPRARGAHARISSLLTILYTRLWGIATTVGLTGLLIGSFRYHVELASCELTLFHYIIGS